MSAQWSELHRRAKALEARLETKIQRYASLAQKINADFLCDEENPLLENREEQELGIDIERDLSELLECIDAMRHCNQSSSHTLAHNQDILIKRYQEIHFDYSSEFKTTSAAVNRKRESMELFQSSKKMHAEEHDSSVAKLLRERSSIAASLKSVNDLISEAFDTRNNLSSQRSSLTGASGSLSGLSARMPTFNSLIDGIQRKKFRESLTIGIIISLLLCFSLWWMFLRRVAYLMEVLSEIPGLVDPQSEATATENHHRSSSHNERMLERCKFIPMRLTDDERVLLNILENALDVSEYTDTVDVFARKPKSDRIIAGLVDILSISSGLMVSNNLSKGEGLMKTNSLADNINFFRDMFEIGRRYKIMNPSKMRETYGKMMFILQDTETHIVKSETGLSFIKEILTVETFLSEKNGLAMLTDSRIEEATCSIGNADGEKTREVLLMLSQRKQEAINHLVNSYTTERLTAADIIRVLDSISDNSSYLEFNVSPVDRTIRLLRKYFNPNSPPDDPLFSLELSRRNDSSRYGTNRNTFSSIYGYSQRYFGSGACLTHDHKTQFTFVLQSLCLWKEIMNSMPRLWLLADQDMLTEYYRLSDTGQGFHRVQSCPRVGGEMRRILRHVQQNVGQSWVGLSVVHLGDRDVPNALVFIDKYCQVPRILAPIASCLENLPQLIHDNAFHEYVRNEWGSIDGLRMQIMSDFFKHGFDGSGDDGGSCIDGRLTSAWNWCSKLHKKPYYHVFMFTGFQGFDGDWKED